MAIVHMTLRFALVLAVLTLSPLALAQAQQDTDLALTKVDGADPVAAGEVLAYTLTLTNNGPLAAANVVVTDPLPANTSFVSVAVTADGFVTNFDGTLVTISTPSLAAGVTVTIDLQVQVNGSAPDGTTIVNTATVTSQVPDSNPANNTATATTAVTSGADLALTKSDAPDPVLAGGILLYTLTLTNNGPVTAANVLLSDAIPAATTFVSATVTSGAADVTFDGTAVTAALASLAPGASLIVEIRVQVSGTAAPGDTITNSATVTSDTPDGNTVNNTATSTTTVTAAEIPLLDPRLLLLLGVALAGAGMAALRR